MRKTILILAAIFASGILFVNVYTSIVDVPNWGRDLPGSIMAAREYFRAANPGTFFRVVSPINQVLGLLALIVCWRAGSRIRIYCALALICAVVGDIFTFAYFYPRNGIMFVAPIDVDAIRTALAEWSTMNWVRSAVVALEVVFDFLALILVAKH
jgi:hypothetical protein